MAKTDLGGVWRTVGGRRIFIKDGEDLATAMKKSGKFKEKEIKNKDNKEEKSIYDMNDEELEEELKNIDENINDIIQKLIETENENLDKWLEEKNKLEKNGEYVYAEDRTKWFENNFPEYKELTEEQEKLDKKRDEIYKIQKNRTYAENGKKIQKIIKETKFYSEDIKDQIENLYYGDDDAMTKVSMLIELDKVAKENNFIISQSPYSFSTYALEKGGEITWGSKPVGSYRISDHWNFESRGKTHCKLTGVKGYTQKFILAKYNGETYDIIKEFD